MSEASPQRLRLGTRASALALWQARHVRDLLLAHWGAAIEIELVEITTEGDRILDRPLNQVGGKGLFVTGIEDRLLDRSIDFAVHSMKDLPGHTPDGLAIVCTPERADPRDVLVGPGGATLAGLPAGTRVGTSSLRRAALAKRINPGIEIVSIRGNVPTRIKKIADGVCDVVLLAAAGLERLELSQHVAQYLDVDSFCPAACQGILAIEARSDDVGLHELLAPLEHTDTATRAAAERAFLARLEGGCQVPMACHAWLRRGTLNVRGLVVGVDGEPLFEARELGASTRAAELGLAVAQALLRAGADEILSNAKVK